ncbi:MAG: hypothetical protein ACPG44_00930 [Polaribacter sp.]
MNKQEKTHIDTSTTLIMYGKANSNLSYKNGLFDASDKKAVAQLNSELKKYRVDVFQVGSKKESLNTKKISTNPIFRLQVKGDVASLQSFLLELTTIIDAAYIKPQSEEPSIER